MKSQDVLQFPSRKLLVAIAILATFSGMTLKADQLVLYTFGTAGVNGQGAANGGNALNAWSDFTNNLLSFASGLNTNGTAGGSMGLTYRVSGTLGDSTGGLGTTPGYDAIDARVLTSAATPISSIYFQFSFTAASDFYLNGISYDLASGSTGAAIRGAELQYSLDNFATSTVLGTNSVASGATADNFFYESYDLDDTLVTAGETVTFRFNPFVSTGGAGGVRFDNIEVDAMPVPEPASMALIGLGGLGALFLKRRKA